MSARAAASRKRPVEYSILYTATLCLLAFGAVMVYSASSAESLLSGSGDASYYLKRYVVLGMIGLVLMHLAARHGLRLIRGLTPLLLGASFVLTVAVMLPGIGALLVAAGTPIRNLAILGGTIAGLALMLALVEPYRRERLTAFLDPFADAGDSGFQAVQALTAIGSGGFFGVGLGESVQKIFYLPEAHTDMILAIIGEELGLIGILAVIGLYGMIAYAGLRAAKAARDLYSKLLAAGVTSLILCQATLNFFAVMGMAPLTGVPLPFLSYGSSNLIVLLAAMGLLLNVAATRGGGPPRRGGGRGRGSRRSRGDAMPKVVIAAGGTAGHVVPALAVADALRARGAEVEFVGGERAEAELVPAAGYPFHRLRVTGIDRSNPLQAVWALSTTVWVAGRAHTLLRRLRPDAVLGGGGYVSAPVGLAARALRLPLVLTEADSHLGLTNRLLAPLARRVFLAFPIEGRTGSRWVVSGRPVPAGTGSADRAAARERFGIGADEACVLVFGGSLGARRLNDATLDAFGAAAPGAVLHASGRRDHDDLRRRLDALGSAAHYHLYPYFAPFAAALAAADLAVARAGGGVQELLVAGLPSVLVPYPHATADHQTKNARWAERAGAAVVVPDAELDGPRLAREVAALLCAPQRMAEMANAAAPAGRPRAAERIADELLRLAGGAAAA